MLIARCPVVNTAQKLGYRQGSNDLFSQRLHDNVNKNAAELVKHV
jgi:hypothetical protein